MKQFNRRSSQWKKLLFKRTIRNIRQLTQQEKMLFSLILRAKRKDKNKDYQSLHSLHPTTSLVRMILLQKKQRPSSSSSIQGFSSSLRPLISPFFTLLNSLAAMTKKTKIIQKILLLNFIVKMKTSVTRMSWPKKLRRINSSDC